MSSIAAHLQIADLSTANQWIAFDIDFDLDVRSRGVTDTPIWSECASSSLPPWVREDLSVSNASHRRTSRCSGQCMLLPTVQEARILLTVPLFHIDGKGRSVVTHLGTHVSRDGLWRPSPIWRTRESSELSRRRWNSCSRSTMTTVFARASVVMFAFGKATQRSRSPTGIASLPS